MVEETETYSKQVLINNIAYRDGSNQVTSWENTSGDSYGVTYTYTYDDNGNIKTVNDGSYTTTYTYDGANQLIREDNQRAGKTWAWIYDDAGNLVKTETYVYTTGTLGSTISTVSNVYGDSQWGDLLTKHGSAAFTYDEIGNTLTDGTWTYTWERGRQLKSMTDGTTTWNMTYDPDGLRTSRTDGTNTYYYYYSEGLLTYMKYNALVMRFTYDANGNPVSMTYNGNIYFYVLNLQGDVMALLDASGNEVVSYHYNAWGELLSTTASTTGMLYSLALYNPLRYRGYVYDRETGLYYLQSRYYNPEICRFINADNQFSVSSPVRLNMFAYCNNNPVIYADSTGHAAETLLDIVSIGMGIADVCNNPSDGWAWVGLSADLLDLIPFVTCLGEGVRAYRAINTISDVAKVADDVHDTVRTIDNSVDGVTTVYRSVSKAEAIDIINTGRFNLPIGGMESKQFGLSLAETRKFGNWARQDTIVCADLPANALSLFCDTQVDPHIFRAGTITVYDDQLDLFNQLVQGTIRFIP